MRKVSFAHGSCSEDRGWLLSRGGERKELLICAVLSPSWKCGLFNLFTTSVSVRTQFFAWILLYVLQFTFWYLNTKVFLFSFLSRIACLIVTRVISKFHNGNSILEYLSSLNIIIYWSCFSWAVVLTIFTQSWFSPKKKEYKRAMMIKLTLKSDQIIYKQFVCFIPLLFHELWSLICHTVILIVCIMPIKHIVCILTLRRQYIMIYSVVSQKKK